MLASSAAAAQSGGISGTENSKAITRNAPVASTENLLIGATGNVEME